MSSQLEDFAERRNTHIKLGPAFVHADVESILQDAHELRDTDGVPFTQGLDIYAGKTRPAYGTVRSERSFIEP